jgi:hypothetical protein
VIITTTTTITLHPIPSPLPPLVIFRLLTLSPRSQDGYLLEDAKRYIERLIRRTQESPSLPPAEILTMKLLAKQLMKALAQATAKAARSTRRTPVVDTENAGVRVSGGLRIVLRDERERRKTRMRRMVRVMMVMVMAMVMVVVMIDR